MGGSTAGDPPGRSTRPEGAAAGEIGKLREENARLVEANAELRKRQRELDARISQLLGELAEFRRDRSRTYVAGGPQAHVIGEDLTVLKDQDVRRLGREIFSLLPKSKAPAAAERREAMARIKSTLAREILIEEYRLRSALRQRDELEAFVDSLDRLPVTETQRGAIAEVLASDMAAPAEPDERDLRDRSRAVLQSLGLHERGADDPLGRNVELLLSKGAGLVEKVLSADPPGTLWMDEPGARFDAARHEPELGCEEDGVVRWTSYPGYQVGDRIICKAAVFTVPRMETTDVEGESDAGAAAETAAAEAAAAETAAAETAAGETRIAARLARLYRNFTGRRPS